MFVQGVVRNWSGGRIVFNHGNGTDSAKLLDMYIAVQCSFNAAYFPTSNTSEIALNKFREMSGKRNCLY